MKPHIPSFYLYGEPHQKAEEDFVHVEPLDDRTRPSEWTIHPHSHADLNHIFLVSSGGGIVVADGAQLHFSAPALLIVPATTVHGFHWLEESDGLVLTLASRYLAQLSSHTGELGGIFDSVSAVPLTADAANRVTALGHDLIRELSWSAPGRRAAVDGTILSLLVLTLRHMDAADRISPRLGPHASTVARFRERVEQRYRLREAVSVHAAALGVSETTLRMACTRIADSSPSQMLDERIILEAKRSLLYSNLSVAKIGFALGFPDPAYFSRFFRARMGVSPRQFREHRPDRTAEV